jgi:hypothetical protein
VIFAAGFFYLPLEKEASVNLFDKICAVLAFALGAALLILGVIGLFTGCRAHFTLPPILGALPAIAGWGIIKPIIVAWKSPPGGAIPRISEPGGDDYRAL